MTTKEIILQKVEESFKKAEAFYGKTFSRPDEYIWKRNGSVAGFCRHSPRKKAFMFQLDLAEKNMDDYINQVVPHEVAHYIQFEHYGYYNNKPHGRQWKFVMVQVMGIPAIRCHEYDLGETKTRQFKKVVYVCDCQEFSVTLKLHNKMQHMIGLIGKSGRFCRNCKGSLRLKDATIISPDPIQQKIKALEAELQRLNDSKNEKV